MENIGDLLRNRDKEKEAWKALVADLRMVFEKHGLTYKGTCKTDDEHEIRIYFDWKIRSKETDNIKIDKYDFISKNQSVQEQHPSIFLNEQTLSPECQNMVVKSQQT